MLMTTLLCADSAGNPEVDVSTYCFARANHSVKSICVRTIKITKGVRFMSSIEFCYKLGPLERFYDKRKEVHGDNIVLA